MNVAEKSLIFALPSRLQDENEEKWELNLCYFQYNFGSTNDGRMWNKRTTKTSSFCFEFKIQIHARLEP